VEVSTEQCTPTSLRFEGRTEEDFAQPGKFFVIYFAIHKRFACLKVTPEMWI
jgi:hypothetical protein